MELAEFEFRAVGETWRAARLHSGARSTFVTAEDGEGEFCLPGHPPTALLAAVVRMRRDRFLAGISAGKEICRIEIRQAIGAAEVAS